MIGGLEVVATPGHTPGHIALWRPHDRVLACGDAVATAAPLRFREAVQPAPRLTGTDELDERESVRRLASLRPSILLPGHGNPVRTPQAIVEYAASLRI
jgi:glyoxylase-like metal-dependent hydrolase (beta-lactamase superfamily II)